MIAADRNGEPALRSIARQCRNRLFGALEDAVDLAQNALARDSQHEFVGQPLEQVETEIFFELADFSGNCRDRLLQSRRGQPQAALPGDEVEGPQALQVETVDVEHEVHVWFK